MNNIATPHQRKALANKSNINIDSIQPDAFNIKSADKLLKPVVTKSNNHRTVFCKQRLRLQEI